MPEKLAAVTADITRELVKLFHGRVEVGSNQEVTKAILSISGKQRFCRFEHGNSMLVRSSVTVGELSAERHAEFFVRLQAIPEGRNAYPHLFQIPNGIGWWFDLIFVPDDECNEDIFQLWFQLACEELALSDRLAEEIAGVPRKLIPSRQELWTLPLAGEA